MLCKIVRDESVQLSASSCLCFGQSNCLRIVTWTNLCLAGNLSSSLQSRFTVVRSTLVRTGSEDKCSSNETKMHVGKNYLAQLWIGYIAILLAINLLSDDIRSKVVMPVAEVKFKFSTCVAPSWSVQHSPIKVLNYFPELRRQVSLTVLVQQNSCFWYRETRTNEPEESSNPLR